MPSGRHKLYPSEKSREGGPSTRLGTAKQGRQQPSGELAILRHAQAAHVAGNDPSRSLAQLLLERVRHRLLEATASAARTRGDLDDAARHSSRSSEFQQRGLLKSRLRSRHVQGQGLGVLFHSVRGTSFVGLKPGSAAGRRSGAKKTDRDCNVVRGAHTSRSSRPSTSSTSRCSQRSGSP